MAAQKEYSSNYPLILAMWIRCEGRKPHRDIAKFLCVSSATVSRWRKEYPLFDKAIVDPNGVASERMMTRLFDLLESDNEITVNNAINTLVKMGFGQSKGLDHQIKEEIERQLDKSDSKHDETKAMKIFEAWKSGELDNGAAEAQLLFSGLPVPSEIVNALDEVKTMSRLRELAVMKKEGIITESQFNELVEKMNQ
jgi:uncharacterized protein YjcR